MSKERYLVTDIYKKNYFQSSKYIFIDEYLKKFYEKKNKPSKSNFLVSINSYSKINYSSKFVLKKLIIYRDQLYKKFNKLNNVNFSKKYWGAVLDQFIFLILNQIYIERKLLFKIFSKNKKIIVNKETFEKSYLDTQDYISSRIKDNNQAFSRYIIAKNIGFKVSKFIKKRNYIENRPKKNEGLFKKLLRNIIYLYINIQNPTLIINGYIGKKAAIKVFFRSFGKILFLPGSVFFQEKKLNKKLNKKRREELSVIEKDKFDLIFNILFKKFLPTSYLENYSKYNTLSKKFSNLNKIGSAVHFIYNDEFKFLTSKIINRKGKYFSLPHGGLLGQNKDDYDQIVEKKYATKVFRWQDRSPLEYNQLKNLQTYKQEIENKKKHILFYPTGMMVKSNYKIPLLRKYHPYYNFYYDLYDKLNLDLKNKVKIKLLHHENNSYFKNHWTKIYKKNIFLKKNRFLFNNSKIVIIDDYSTPICELLYTNTPFIIIDPEEKNLNKNILIKILRLKKINILFEDIQKASNFLNKNFKELDEWWLKVSKDKIYLDLKNNLIPNQNTSLSFNEALR